MTSLLDVIAEAWRGIARHPLRSVLSTAGIAIALAAIVSVLAAEQSWQAEMQRGYEGLGANRMWVELPAAMPEAKRRQLTTDDAAAIRRRCPAVNSVGVLVGPVSATVRAGRFHAQLNAYQYSPEWLAVKSWEVRSGAAAPASVHGGCLLSPVAARSLLGDDYARSLPAAVRIDGRTTPLRGIVQVPPDSDEGAEGYLLLPRDGRYARFGWVAIAMTSSRMVEAAGEVDALLSERMGAGETVHLATGPWLMAAEAVAGRARLRLFTGVALACILVVAVLGVAGTLIANLEERTREIALRRALGAQAAHIRCEIFAEATLISVIGGLAGCVAALGLLPTAGAWLFRTEALPGLGAALERAMQPPTPAAGLVVRLHWQPLLVSAITCLGAAILAGWLPASSAVGVTPSAALCASPPRRRSMGWSLAGVQCACGVSAAIILLALYAGLGNHALAVLRRFVGGDSVTLYIRALSFTPAARSRARRTELALWQNPALLASLVRRCDEVTGVDRFLMNGDLEIKHGRDTTRARMFAVDSGLANAMRADQATVALGRAINERDNQSGARVCVIGRGIQRELLGAVAPLGQQIRMAGLPFTVVGVISHSIWRYPDRPFTLTPDRDVICPIGALPSTWSGGRGLVFGLRDYHRWDAAEAEITAAITSDLGTLRDVRMRFVDSGMLHARLEKSARALAVRAVLIGSTGLWVALVGLVNVLFVSFQARTREFGLVRALGAPRCSVIRSGVAEGVVIAGVGALAGLAAASGLAAVLGRLAEIPVSLPAGWVALVVSCTVVAGGLAALLPAAQAASADPAVALRSD